MDELSNWYRGLHAEFIQLRTEGSRLKEQHFDLRYHPGETDSARATDLPDTCAAAYAFKVRCDELVESGWTRRIETDFPVLHGLLARHEPFQTWARISRRELPLETLFSSWCPVVDPLPAFTRCSFAERGPGEGFALEAEWEAPRGPIMLSVGPPASPRSLSTLPQPTRSVFAAHSFVTLASFDDELPSVAISLPTPWTLRSGNLVWRLNESGQLVGEDEVRHSLMPLLWGTLRGTLQLALGT